MSRPFYLLVCLLLLLLASAAHALEADELMTDPAKEARAVALGARLRCVVCQMQSINDSPAPLARDLRRLIREQIAAGQTDDAVIAHLRERYGDYVLLEPPFQPNTWLLWAAPAILLAAGGTAAFALLRRRGKA